MKRQKRTFRVCLLMHEDMGRALMRLADSGRDRLPATIRHILRTHLILSPTSYRVVPFPPEQSLELWVWAHEQRQKTEPPLNPEEKLILSRDGSKVLRLDLLTAA